MKSISILVIASIFFFNFLIVSKASVAPACTAWNVNLTLVCDTISAAHNLLSSTLNVGLAYQHCNFLLLTPHCCEQLCIPSTRSGVCEQNTGVCRCSGNGIPSICNQYFNASNPKTDPKLLAVCASKCSNTLTQGACTTPAYVTDGANYACVCYCS